MTAMPPVPAPEGEIVRKPLQFFWLVDSVGVDGGQEDRHVESIHP